MRIKPCTILLALLGILIVPQHLSAQLTETRLFRISVTIPETIGNQDPASVMTQETSLPNQRAYNYQMSEETRENKRIIFQSFVVD